MDYATFIESLQIFAKYSKDGLKSPVPLSSNDNEDGKHFVAISPSVVSEEDNKRLFDLGWDADKDCFHRWI